MPLEKRTCVEIFLPVARNSTVNNTVREWLAEEFAFARGGSTITTPFTGLYLSAAQTEIVRDAIQVLFCDFDLDPNDPVQGAEPESYLSDVRLMLLQAFRQEEIWIVYHSVTRIR